MPHVFHLSRRRTCLLLVLLALSSTALLFPPSLRRPKSPSLPPQAPSPPSFLSIPGPLVRDESLPSEIYQQFATPPPPSRRSSDQGVLPVPMLGPACLTSWIAEGVLGDGCTVDGAAGVDFVWTWLNGSDPRWKDLKKKYSKFQIIGRVQTPPARHYRDHGELQASLRSVAAALPAQSHDQDQVRFHVVLGDWVDNGKQLGQRPAWLRDQSGVDLVWHSQIWQDYERYEKDEGWEARRETLSESLPTFNSFSIESSLFNVNVSQACFVAMNDDFFFTAPHSTSDLYSPIYGPVIPLSISEADAFQPVVNETVKQFNPARWNLWRTGGLIGANSIGGLSCNHEGEALMRSNWMIGARFGLRPRPATMHVPKPLLLPILSEVSIIWGENYFAKSSRRRFREDAKRRPGDFHAIWLGTHYLLERSRESLLWTWAVAKMGQEADVKGVWGEKERRILRDLWDVDAREEQIKVDRANEVPTLWELLFGQAPTLREIVISKTNSTHRHTLLKDKISTSLSLLGAEAPQANDYGWSFLDGPPPPFGATRQACSITFRQCFGSFWSQARPKASAEDMFKRIAFELPFCGDCILSSLIQASGPLGLNSLLPSKDIVVPSRASPFGSDPPGQHFLPLTPGWRVADFSVDSVLNQAAWGETVVLRDWCAQLIARYAWTVSSNSTSVFTMVQDQKSLDKIFAKVAISETRPATVGLNDDIAGRDSEETSKRLAKWLEKQWSAKGSWER